MSAPDHLAARSCWTPIVCRPGFDACRRGDPCSRQLRPGSDGDCSDQLQGGMAMLVLTRRVGKEIVIDGGIVITVVGVKGGLVRLGITAPPSVCVDRQEVHERRTEFTIGKEEL